MNAQAAQLTILTVVLEDHYDYAREQTPLIEALNSDVPFKMIIVDNSGTGRPGLRIDHPNVEVVAGVASDDTLPSVGRGSYHHAAALNMLLPRIDTRYLLVLDPDFFVIYRNWITECLDHMSRRGLTFFGAPWHYRWNWKWRYFPCPHFLLIDLGKVDRAQIDFTPALVEDNRLMDSPILAWLERHAPALHSRLFLEARRDTGWRLNQKFRKDPNHLFDLTLPVIDSRAELREPRHLFTARGRWFERLLPRRWSFLPTPGTYVEADQAPAFDFSPIRSLAPEKFVWRGAPFAAHLRGVMREDMRTGANPRHKERGPTQALLEAVKTSACWTDWGFKPAGQS